MKRYGLAVKVGFGVAGMLVMAHGCTVNPFDPPSFDDAPANKDLASSTSSSSGMGGMGGTSSGGGGVAGSSNSNGGGGAGGAPCMCSDDGNECTTDVVGACPAGDPKKCHSVRLDEPCGADGGMDSGYWCNAAANCADCRACDMPDCADRCNGLKCDSEGTTNPQCASQYCQQFVCCGSSCKGPCKACNREGKLGTCVNLPLGLEVPDCDHSNGATNACDGFGACDALEGVKPLGVDCGKDLECVTNVCKAGKCRSSVGQSCVEHIECGTNLCDPTTKTCQQCGAISCSVGSSCVKYLGQDICQAIAGQPAEAKEECAAGEFVDNLCLSPTGKACKTDAECLSHICTGGSCAAAPCTNGIQCASKICDTGWGWCKLGPGAYCAKDSHCASTKCTGFPPRCQ